MRYAAVEFRLPAYFIDRYDEEIAAWAANFSRIGPVKTFVLKEGRLSDPSPAEDQGPVLKGARLRAEISARGVVVEPASEADEAIIRRHCEKMEKAGWPARLFDKEPLRPGLPVFPTIAGKGEDG